MIRTTNMLLGGWPHSTEIRGRSGNFLGWRVKCRYPNPWGMKLLPALSFFLWLGLFILFCAMLPEETPAEDTTGALLILTGIAGAILQGALYAALLGKLEMEIRPQVIRWRRWHGGWASFNTPLCEVALLPHDAAGDEEAKEQERMMELQKGRNVEMPGRWFRSSASVALVVSGQRVDIASVYKPRNAQDIYLKLAALLADVRERQWGY